MRNCLSLIALLIAAAVCLPESRAIMTPAGLDPNMYDPNIGSKLPCGEDNLSCPQPNGELECYNRTMLCDGEAFCLGGSDEGFDLVALDCDGSFFGEERTFWCGFFIDLEPYTVTLEQLCDGIDDCGNGIDEKTTLCENKCRSDYYGGCHPTSQCITSEFAVNCRCRPGDYVIATNGECGPVPVIALDDAEYRELEDTSVVSVCASVIGGEYTPFLVLPVTLKITNGSAIDGEDYGIPADTMLTFANNARTQCINITIVDDDIVEELNEYFTVELLPSLRRNPTYTLTTNGTTISTVYIEDNDAINVKFVVGSQSVMEDVGIITLEVQLLSSGGASFPITVNVQTDNGTTEGQQQDWYLGLTQFTLQAPGFNYLLQITINDDSLVEETEMFSLSLEPIDPRMGFTPSPTGDEASVTIIDNDEVTVGLELSEYSVSEGQSRQICVTLESGELERDAFVNVSTSESMPKSAEEGQDYSPLMLTITLPAGLPINGTACFNLDTIEDDLVEGRESLELEFSSNDRAVILSQSTAIVFINDNDVALFGFEQSMYAVNENDGSLQVFIILLEKQLAVSITLRANASDVTAMTGADYIFPSTDVMFAPGSVMGDSQTISISVFTDSIVENTETFNLNLYSRSPLADIKSGRDLATVEIADNSTARIGFELDMYSLREGDGELEVCLILESGTLDREVDITLASADATALAPADYIQVRSMTFAPSDNGRKCLNVTILDDSLVERREDFMLTITTSDPAVSLSRDEATVTIIDNDQIVLSFEQSSYTASEGMLEIVIAVEISGGNLATDITFLLESKDDSAVAPNDYSPFFSMLTFSSGTVSGATLSYPISITDDDILEPTEKFTVCASSMDDVVQFAPGGNVTSVYIEDNDSVRLALVQSSYTVDEDVGQLSLNVELSEGTLERDVIFVLASTDNTAIEALGDYTSFSEMLTFLSGSQQGDTVSLSVTILDDMRVEDLEDFTIHAGSMDIDVMFGNQYASIFIRDNDEVTVGLELSEYSVSEGQSRQVCVTLESGELERDAFVNASTSESMPKSAEEGQDYSPLMLTFTLPAGLPINGTACFNLDTIDDDLVEGMESLELEFSSNDRAVILSQSTANVFINDNDVALFGFEQSMYAVNENDGSLQVFIILLEKQLAVSITLHANASDVTAVTGADYLFPSTDVMFAPGSVMGDSQTVSISVLTDSIVENTETFNLNLYSRSPLADIGSGRDLATVEIADNSTARIGFELDMYSLREGDGELEVCLILESGTLDREVDITLASADATALAPVDYIQVRSMTFAPSDNGRKCLNVTILDDSLVERREDFMLTITTSDPAVSLSRDEATVTIIDNDQIVLSFEQSSYTASEGMLEIVIAVEISGGNLATDITFLLESKDDSAVAPNDYSPFFSMLTFSSGTVSGATLFYSISITDDNILEPTERFTVCGSSMDDVVQFAPGGNVTSVYIEDNDSVRLALVQSSYTVDEDVGQLSLNVELSEGTLERDVIFVLASTDNTAIEALGDYTRFSEMLTFLSGSQQGDTVSLSVTILDDMRVEDLEDFTIHAGSMDIDVMFGNQYASIFIRDNDEVTVGLELSEYSVSEGQSRQVCVTLESGELERDAFVNVSTSECVPKSAEEGQDYSPLMLTITLPAGLPINGTACFNLDTIDDDLVEGKESLELEFSSNDRAVILSQSTANVFINDNDVALFGFEQSMYAVNENDGSLEVFIILLEKQLAVSITLRANASDVTAVTGADYLFPSTDVMFAPGSVMGDSQTVPISVLTDSIVENTETFNLNLYSRSPLADIGSGRDLATVEIADNSTARIGFELDMYSLREGDGEVEVCLILESGTLDREVDITLASADATALAPADYIQVRSMTFAPSDNGRKCLNVTILDDSLVERREDFMLTITTSDPAVSLSRDEATVTIIDNDQIFLSFEQSSYTASEGMLEIVIAVEISGGNLATDITFLLESKDDSAVAPNDYSPFFSMLTFSSGTVSGATLFYSISITDDNILEPTERFTVCGSSMDDVVQFAPGGNVTSVYIEDNDSVRLALVQSSYTVDEDVGQLSLNVELSEGTLERDVIFVLASTDNTAIEALGDYIRFSEMLTFLSGSQQGDTVSLSVTILDDMRVEDLEDFTIHAGSMDMDVMFGNQYASIFIRDNDEVTVGLELSEYSVSEGQSRQVCVTLESGELERDAFVNVSTSECVPKSAEEGQDYSPLMLTITLPAGLPINGTACFNLDTIDDDLVEGMESLELEFSSNDIAVILSQSTANVFINDNDVALFGFEQSMYAVNENDGSLEVFIILLEKQLAVSITLRANASDVTAVTGADYLFPSTDVMFAPGSVMGDSQTVSISFLTDSIVENTETFNLNLYSRSPLADIGSGRDLATVEIADNSTARIGFELDMYSLREGDGELEVCLILESGTLEREVDITLASADATALAPADYIQVRSMTFAPSDNGRKCLNVTILDDSLVERREDFMLTITTSDPAVSLSRDEATVTIIDNDQIVLSFEQSSYTASEGMLEIVIAVEISGGNLATDITFLLESKDDSATAPNDYSPFFSMLTFSSGTVSGATLFYSISITDDNILEPTEKFTVCGSSMDDVVQFAPGGNVTSVYIEDNDSVRLALVQSSYTVDEDVGQLSLNVELSEGTLERDVIFVLASTDNTAIEALGDYTRFSEMLTFLSGSQQGDTVSLSVTILDDMRVEDLEDFTIHAGSMDMDVMFGNQYASIFIRDNDEVTVGLELSEYSVSEGQSRQVCVTLESGELERDAFVNASTSESMPKSAEEGQDYSPLMLTITLPAGLPINGTACFNLDTIEDDLVEGRESLELEFSSNDRAVILSQSTANVFINDNDVALFGLEQSMYAVNENDGSLQVFIILLEKQLAVSITLRANASDVTAVTGADYLFPSTDVMFAPGSVMGDSQTISISVFTDSIVENTETFNLNLYSRSPLADIGSGRDLATVGIADNSTARIGFELDMYSLREGDGELEVCLILESGTLDREVDITLASADATALAPADYIQVRSMTFAPSDNGRKCLNVTILDDSLVENTERFLLSLITSDPTVSLSRSEANVTIIDDDRVIVALVPRRYKVSEDVGEFYVYAKIVEGALDRDAVVLVQTTDGSAESEEGDYESFSQELTFTSGSSVGSVVPVKVVIGNDKLVEDKEYFTVNISSSDPIVVVDDNRDVARVIIEDDECHGDDEDSTSRSKSSSYSDSSSSRSRSSKSHSDSSSSRSRSSKSYSDSSSSRSRSSKSYSDSSSSYSKSKSRSRSRSSKPRRGKYYRKYYKGPAFGDDPHFSIVLPTGNMLCYTVQGEHGFSFNLISNKKLHMNAKFVQDAVREEVTWMGSMGIVLHNGNKQTNDTKLRFEADEKKIYIGEKVVLEAKGIEKLSIVGDKLMISETNEQKDYYPSVLVEIEHLGLSFTIKFMNNHLDMFWHNTGVQLPDSHGLVGQFFRKGVEIDEVRKILIMPNKEPIPVMRRPVWSFMEREVPDEQLCWTAMNSGYQGEGLIDGTYFDYLMDDVLSINQKSL